MAERLKPEQRDECERQAWLLRVKGWTVERIAEHLEVHKSTVSRMLDRREAALAKEFTGQAERIKARQTAQLEHVYSEALQQWERSCEDAESEKVVTKAVLVSGYRQDEEGNEHSVDLPAPETTTTHDTKGQSGNPALLAQAREALADIRGIWGLDAPKKQDLTTGGQPFKVYAGFDPEQV